MRTNINSKNYLVFQAYGAESIMHECLFALLTLCQHQQTEDYRQWEIWIYTDKPSFFQSFSDCPLPIFYREIDQETIRNWHGKIDFVHRVKIEVLRDFTSKRSGNILYLDTDICFTQPLATIFSKIEQGELLMHIMEGKVHDSDNIVLKKLSKFLLKHKTLQVGGNPLIIPYETAMWNAGVLGFNSNKKNLLEQVLLFTDDVFPMFPKHVVEQFAFSYYFQQNNNLKTANSHIIHYWNAKEVRPILTSFFKYFKNEKWDELVRLSAMIQFPDYMQQKANYYQSRSVVSKLLKKHWQPKVPNWEEMKNQI